MKEVWGDVSGYETYGYTVEKTIQHDGMQDGDGKACCGDNKDAATSGSSGGNAYSFEIRKYDPRVAVCSTAPRPFMILAGYIGVGSEPKNNGGDAAKKAEPVAMTTPVVMSNNAKPTPVAMTTPVVMSNLGDGKTTQNSAADSSHNSRTFKNQHEEMAFMLPAKYKTVEECPTPDDPRVYLKQVPEIFKACHRYSPSFFSGDTYEDEAKKLRAAVESSGLKLLGDVERHGFNPPYTLVNKRTDVCVNIEWPPQPPAKL